ncbi:hypothetical protein FOPE_02981 [Fonsecaea pedrosoi]|nr:hypothetical protein FOPE_02981 [Fonsecaea pedrosoi]
MSNRKSAEIARKQHNASPASVRDFVSVIVETHYRPPEMASNSRGTNLGSRPAEKTLRLQGTQFRVSHAEDPKESALPESSHD